MPHRTRIDPKRTSVHGHRLNPDAVRYYQGAPGGRYRGGGGRVVAQQQRDGSTRIVNGAHRRQAAINTGRKLHVDLYAAGEKLPRTEPGGCALVVIAVLGGLAGLAGLAAALREVLPL